MTDLTQEIMPKRVNLSAVFWAGLVLLFLMALICLLWLSLFAEALLVPYECCDLAAKPSLGSWQRTINDFFAAFPGRLESRRESFTSVSGSKTSVAELMQ